jgi:hypothetical protein
MSTWFQIFEIEDLDSPLLRRNGQRPLLLQISTERPPDKYPWLLVIE